MSTTLQVIAIIVASSMVSFIVGLTSSKMGYKHDQSLSNLVNTMLLIPAYYIYPEAAVITLWVYVGIIAFAFIVYPLILSIMAHKGKWMNSYSSAFKYISLISISNASFGIVKVSEEKRRAMLQDFCENK